MTKIESSVHIIAGAWSGGGKLRSNADHCAFPSDGVERCQRRKMVGFPDALWVSGTEEVENLCHTVDHFGSLLLGGCFDGSPLCGRTPTIAALSGNVCPPTSQRWMDSDVPQPATRAPPEPGTPVTGGQSLQPVRNANVVERRLNFRRDTNMGIGSPMGTGARFANARHLRSQCNHRHGGAPRLRSGHGHPSDAARLPAASPHPDPAHQHSNLHHAPGRQLATTSR